MNYLSHLFIGFILCLVGVYFLYPLHLYSFKEVFIFLLVGVVSSLIPDLDHSKSKGTKILNISVLILVILFSHNLFLLDFSFKSITNFIIFSIVFYFAWVGISTFLRPKHRGITHSLLALFIYSLILYFVFNWIFVLAGIIGYFSHLLADRSFKIT